MLISIITNIIAKWRSLPSSLLNDTCPERPLYQSPTIRLELWVCYISMKCKQCHFYELRSERNFLLEAYGELTQTDRTVGAWFDQFKSCDLTYKRKNVGVKNGRSRIWIHIHNDDSSLTLEKMGGSLNFYTSTVSKRFKTIGIIQNEKYWVRHELRPRDLARTPNAKYILRSSVTITSIDLNRNVEKSRPWIQRATATKENHHGRSLASKYFITRHYKVIFQHYNSRHTL